MILEADQMAFKARALAQAHPFTMLAKKVLDRATEQERASQPVAEFAVWANAAMTKGYCVRRVEEDDEGMVLVGAPEDALPDIEHLEEVTGKIAVAIRSEEADLSEFMISGEDRLFDVLDQVIGSEVRNRIDNASSTPTTQARAELEDYITYWVVKGYALRVAEMSTGALAQPA